MTAPPRGDRGCPDACPPAAPVAGRPGSGEGVAVVGLAREVEALARRVDALTAQVGELAHVVAAVAGTLAGTGAAAADVPVPGSWFTLRAGGEAAAAVLADLDAWVHEVYLSYPDAAATLPSCWPRHGEVVEELLWLSRAWTAAYCGSSASPAAAGDWHDRRRPGVLARLRHLARCTPQRHSRGPARPGPRGGPAPLTAAEIRAVLDLPPVDPTHVKDNP